MLVTSSAERARKRRAGPGRPRLGTHERRTISVTLTLTEGEHAEALQRAAALGLRLRPYLRDAALGCAESGDPAAPAPSIGAREIERLALLREIARHIARSGNNLNQLAHRVNEASATGKNVVAALAAIEPTLAEWREAMTQVHEWPALRSAAGLHSAVEASG